MISSSLDDLESAEISEVAVVGLGLLLASGVPGVPGFGSDPTKRHAGLDIGPKRGIYCHRLNLTS